MRRFSKSASFKRLKERYGQKVRAIPEIKSAMIVSGSSVIADEKMVLEILSRHPSALGLDMEIYGLYSAAGLSQGYKPSVMAIKGVADFGEVEKDDAAQLSASALSAQVFKYVLSELTIFDEPQADLE